MWLKGNPYLPVGGNLGFCIEILKFDSYSGGGWEESAHLYSACHGTVLGMTKSSVKVAQLCPTLCDPMDCSLPGSSVHGIIQARILEWVAIPFSRGSSWPRNRTQVSHIAGRFYMVWATREAQSCNKPFLLCTCWDAQHGFPMICRLPCSTTGVFLVVFAWRALSEMEVPWWFHPWLQ